MHLPLYCLLPLCLLAAGAAASARAETPPAGHPGPTCPPERPVVPELSWRHVREWGVEGRAWPELARRRWYDRFPAAAEGRVTAAVWRLSRDSTGMMFRFRTDAPQIWVRYTLLKAKLASPNMSAIGASGIDLYARGADGRWRWAGNSRPDAQTVVQPLVWGYDIGPGLREYAAYLPLANGVEELEVGVPPTARFEPVAPRPEKPIVFYGTSITHGSAASRPGLVHTAILGRRLDRPVVNLGFGGNGRMDAAVGEFLVKIDAAAYVIDCLPNLYPHEVTERCAPLVRMLRRARPDTPIVLVEDRRNPNAWLLPERDRHHTDNHAALRTEFARLRQEGVTGLYYLAGDALLGDDHEGTTDGSHPNDLGFMRQADAFEPVLRAALAGSP
ncbi:MAG: SGNH/GDSL hydrolase family protein [Opitutaceae bacterium]|nr:SGNH/GDSL hydrolase family protein [Opitutaceae bacterium]